MAIYYFHIVQLSKHSIQGLFKGQLILVLKEFERVERVLKEFEVSLILVMQLAFVHHHDSQTHDLDAKNLRI